MRRLSRRSPREIAISVIAVAELRAGAAKLPAGARIRLRIDEVLSAIRAVDFTDADATVYADVRATLERRGTPIGALETLIAAHALSRGVTLVTNDVREYSRVAGLRVETWL